MMSDQADFKLQRKRENYQPLPVRVLRLLTEIIDSVVGILSFL